MIWLESRTGKIAAKARLFEGVRPGVLNLPYEYGHVGWGRWADGHGINPNEIANTAHDPLCGVVSRSAVRVRIRRVLA